MAPLFVHASPTDNDFVRTMGLHIISGTDFTLADWMQTDTVQNPSDPHTSYILNESAVKALGWTPEAAIGRTLYRSGHKEIVKAVVKDFHFAPLQEPIEPLVIFLGAYYGQIYLAYIRLSGNAMPATLAAIKTTWKERVTHRSFPFRFLDEDYNRLYHNEQQTAKIFSTFSSFAIILACWDYLHLWRTVRFKEQKKLV